MGLGGSRDFTLPIAAESPAAAGDFELITRPVIMDSGEAGQIGKLRMMLRESDLL